MGRHMGQSGWCWEGLGFDPGVAPSIYGAGEGATFFGVDDANYIFHPNTETAFAKLAHVPKVTAEISKWEWYETERAPPKCESPRSRGQAPARRSRHRHLSSKRCDGQAKSPPRKWMNFYTKVLTKLASAGGLKITVSIQSSPDGGVADRQVEDVKTALRGPGLNDSVDVG